MTIIGKLASEVGFDAPNGAKSGLRTGLRMP
jgi:hypothetical protein